MPAQSPANLTITQLLCADLARECSVGLVKHVLGANRDFGLEMLADEEKEEARGGDDDFCIG